MKRLDNWNIAFLVEIAWAILNNPDSLWVQFMRRKYFISNGRLFVPKDARFKSHLARHLCKV